MQIEVQGGLWQHYQTLVTEKMLPYQWAALNDQLPETPASHVMANFKKAAAGIREDYQGIKFGDSDLYKWLEAASYTLGKTEDKRLQAHVNEAISWIRKAQLADGYLNTFYQIDQGVDKRWTNLRDNHELYCGGHLVEAAVAHYTATGETALLEVAEKFAHHILTTFQEGSPQEGGYPGHEEIELALLRLYQVTTNKEYLELAGNFIQHRGQKPNYFDQEAKQYNHGIQTWWGDNHRYSQAHEPILAQTEAVGHAVRAMYLYTALADFARIKQDRQLTEKLLDFWQDVTTRKMTINGGIGATAWGEAFSEAYDLPNDTAYNETCASIGLVFWAEKMFELTGAAHFIDTLEKALYNGCLCGMDQEGEHFFYVNPLEVTGTSCSRKDHDHVKGQRQSWFGCACCPPNLARLIQSIENYHYYQKKQRLYLNVYGESTFASGIAAQGTQFKMKQVTNYPWAGSIELTIEENGGQINELALRIPAWVKEAKVYFNGKVIPNQVEQGYLLLAADFQRDDKIQLFFDMPVVANYANERVPELVGKVAVTRGPLVYAVETVDNGTDLANIYISEVTGSQLLSNFPIGDSLGIQLEGQQRKSVGSLYMVEKPSFERKELKLVPYFLWGNRGAGDMRIWLNQKN